jgi:hypothetical protein
LTQTTQELPNVSYKALDGFTIAVENTQNSDGKDKAHNHSAFPQTLSLTLLCKSKPPSFFDPLTRETALCPVFSG